MKIGVLTSSRADFGIYIPLLKAMKNDSFFNLEIIAFGTHLSSFYGNTVVQIIETGFEVKHRIESMLLTDSADSVSTAIGLTIIKFSDFWKGYHDQFDLVFCLGDRYEMFAAITSGIPFQVPFAHIHGGETTLGAIDNIFRHSITLASKYHFVSTDGHAAKVAEIIGTNDGVFNVGALGLDNLQSIDFLTLAAFKDKWGIDLSLKTVLTTFHPETVAAEKNEYFANEIVQVIKKLDSFQFLITMPNADTSGNIIRKALVDNFSDTKNVFLIENLGTQSYFTAMKYCSFLMGNTSSGMIEAASFNKYVINLGDRQKGRSAGANVLNVAIDAEQILKQIDRINLDSNFLGDNIYFEPNSAQKIIDIIKEYRFYE